MRLKRNTLLNYMNNIIKLSNDTDILLDDVNLKSIDNVYIFIKYYNTLKEHKNIIDNYSREWDIYKRYMNPYELIYSPYEKYVNISNYKPVSRSFFKMWEILNKFNLIDKDNKSVIANIAEGPGGFIEAIYKYKTNSDDIYISNTLYPNNRNIPSWNKLRNYIYTNQINSITLLYCDLYNYSNIISYISKFKDKKSELITADGGFDYSNNFNKQEEQSYRIIYSEIIIALAIQENKGSFVVKIFDTFTIFTLKCIYLLKNYYSEVYLYKPLTSRIANSEKYIICKGFNGIDNDMLNKLLESIKNFPSNNPDIIEIQLPNNFIYEFDNYNKDFVDNQIKSIDKTLEIIKNNNKDNLDKIIKEQIEKAKEWCKVYNFN